MKIYFLLLVISILSCTKPRNGETPQLEVADSIVRILAIGHSFSMDATERHLRELAVSEGIEVLITN